MFVPTLTQREFRICQGKPHYSQVGNDDTSDVASISFTVFHRIDNVKDPLTATQFFVAESLWIHGISLEYS
jgi:hypothetical protein